MSQTRRLAAILAADVAGYSRLIGADEASGDEALEVGVNRNRQSAALFQLFQGLAGDQAFLFAAARHQ